MKLLVCGDIHLKYEVFDKLALVYEKYCPDFCIQLGDLVDDFGQGDNLPLYRETIERAIKFAEKHRNTIFVEGNHEHDYIHYKPTNASSREYREEIKSMIEELYSICNHSIACRFDNVILSHAGISQKFAESIGFSGKQSIDEMIEKINGLSADELACSNSPLWYRPLFHVNEPMMFENSCFQVVGHTPMSQISEARKIIFCDVFSRIPEGTKEFLLIDTLEPYYYRRIPSGLGKYKK